MRKLAVVVNPAGRDGHALRRWKAAEPVLAAVGFETEVYYTEQVGHASELAFKLRDRQDIELIVACGGDGTVHEVASGMRGSEMRLGIIPGGTGNDVARAHGIPLRKIEQAVAIFDSGTDRHVGAFRLEAAPAPEESGYPEPTNNPLWDGAANVEGRVVRWVFLESDCGVTSQTARAKLTRAKWIKGSFKYTYLGATEILRWKRRSAWIKIDADEPEIVDMTMFCATTSETFGGGYRVSPGASPCAEHGYLCTAWGLTKLQMLALMGPLRKGKHAGKWSIELRPFQRLEIKSVDDSGEPCEDSHEPFLIVQVDGEPCLQTPAVLEHHPRQLWIRGAEKVDWE
jgi:diacylglycerol kinase family enzyme